MRACLFTDICKKRWVIVEFPYTLRFQVENVWSEVDVSDERTELEGELWFSKNIWDCVSKAYFLGSELMQRISRIRVSV
jgi:hypothetical protein